MAPHDSTQQWHHVLCTLQWPKWFVALPPLLEVRTPIAIAIWGKITSKSHHHLFWIPGHKRIQYGMAFTYSEPWGLGGFSCLGCLRRSTARWHALLSTWEIMGRNWKYPLDLGKYPKYFQSTIWQVVKWLVLLKFPNFSSFSWNFLSIENLQDPPRRLQCHPIPTSRRGASWWRPKRAQKKCHVEHWKFLGWSEIPNKEKTYEMQGVLFQVFPKHIKPLKILSVSDFPVAFLPSTASVKSSRALLSEFSGNQIAEIDSFKCRDFPVEHVSGMLFLGRDSLPETNIGPGKGTILKGDFIFRKCWKKSYDRMFHFLYFY